jgi:hypothetical protein
MAEADEKSSNKTMGEYYTKPDHGHQVEHDWVAYVILAVAFVVTFGTIFLLGWLPTHPIG